MMRRRISDAAKAGLVGAGRALPAKAVHMARTSLDYLQLGRWLASRGLTPARRVDTKEEVFAHLVGLVAGRPGVLYLEFGVWTGASLRWWSEHLVAADARFVGFDSFEGLPQDWQADKMKGHFDVGGALPKVDDPRVGFVKGWFDQTLPPFLMGFTPQEQLWIHIDADLYGSALCVLTYLNRHIRPGTVVVFDEVEDLMHEFKALCDFQDMSGKTLELFAATQECRQAAFVCRG